MSKLISDLMAQRSDGDVRNLVVSPAAILRLNLMNVPYLVNGYVFGSLLKTLAHRRGAGLAAPQVGWEMPLFITYWGELFVRPEIIHKSGEQDGEEGCFSLPGRKFMVKRAEQVLMNNGNIYMGFQARVIQHELDHLHGIMIDEIGEEIHGDEEEKAAAKAGG